MKKLLVICGPTATGKTSLGISLAKKLGGEIVSADSRQVYWGMDIGTGKDINKQINKFQINKSMSNDKFQIGCYILNGVKVWLLDVAEPDYRFSVADYVRCASSVIKNIWRRGKLPILVGGTGFYIKSLIDGIGSLGVEPDWGLRKQLSNLAIEQLRKKLRKLDPKKWEGMNESDRGNPRRLIRGIEIAVSDKKTATLRALKEFREHRDILFIGLTVTNKVLYERIDERVDKRVKQGVEKEIKELLKRGYDWENSVLGLTLGYQEWRPYFKGKAAKGEVIQEWKFAEHAYARRQKTWFKRDKRIKWFDISEKGWENKVELLVKRWYNSYPDAKKS